MQIFIMRHGEAEILAASDADRVLTPRGRLQAQESATWLQEQKIAFDAIWVSPYIRAQQTANEVANILTNIPAQETINFITPEDSAQPVQDYLDAIALEKQYQNLLIVSHMPLVSQLVATLSYNKEAPMFKTAAIAQVDYQLEQMRGELVTLFTPKG